MLCITTVLFQLSKMDVLNDAGSHYEWANAIIKLITKAYTY